jgi:hypothetical protein
MKEEVVHEKGPTKPRVKKTAFEIEEESHMDDTGFETVGRDGKVVAYTPESILKSMFRSLMYCNLLISLRSPPNQREPRSQRN